MDTNGKYVVFKAAEFREAMRSLRDKMGWPPEAQMLDAEPISDAHVIREQDVFAAPVLYSYASAVQTAIEVLGQQGGEIPGYLYNARDHFYEAASSAEARKVKRLPDA